MGRMDILDGDQSDAEVTEQMMHFICRKCMQRHARRQTYRMAIATGIARHTYRKKVRWLSFGREEPRVRTHVAWQWDW